MLNLDIKSFIDSDDPLEIILPLSIKYTVSHLSNAEILCDTKIVVIFPFNFSI